MAQGTARIGKDGYRTEIEVGGHALLSDEPARRGGAGAGPAPYELVLAGLGACTAITLRMYADRKQWPMESLDVGLHMLNDGDGILVERTLAVVGALDADQKARLVEIAEKTPVTLTLKTGMRITTRVA
jgi:putative redox protein